MAHTHFYALHCICAKWQRTISSWEDKHASGGQRFHWEIGSIEASPIIRHKDAIKAHVSTMYVRERAFMDQISQICPISTSMCMMSYVKGR